MTLCLNMIVRNEAANIERCLASVADHIACWVIGDTGSDDGTPELIERLFRERGIPGELHHFPFRTFDQARNEALERARASTLAFDYILLTDADMELKVEDPRFADGLDASAYRLRQFSGISYWNTRLIRRDVPARYRGVTHEYLEVPVGETLQLDGAMYVDHATGSSRTVKYERDIRLLTEALAEESDPGLAARYSFYLANTYRDAGDRERALAAYLDRARLGHWQEEVAVSLLNAARLREALRHPKEEVIAAYGAAQAACPWRAEALHGAARYCNGNAMPWRAYDFAAQGLAIAYPKAALFAEDWIYAHGLLDEQAIAAYWTGRHRECAALCDRLLGERRIPADQHPRIMANRHAALDRLREAPEAAEDGPIAHPAIRAARRLDERGEREQAVEAYLGCAGIDAPSQEVFFALYRAAQLMEALDRGLDEILATYRRATEACPGRAEAAHGASRLCRQRGAHEDGYAAAKPAILLEAPADGLFVEPWIYAYGLLDEYAVNAYWAGHYRDCQEACLRLLISDAALPEGYRDRIVANARFALARLDEGRR